MQAAMRLLALPATLAVVGALATSAAGEPTTARTFAVTVTAEVRTTLDYLKSVRREAGCEFTQSNRTVRDSEVTSTRPTMIRVRGGSRATYDPSALRSLLLRRRDDAGELVRAHVCRDGRIGRESTACEPRETVTAATLSELTFRRNRSGRIALSALAQPPMIPCGLEEGGYPADRLDFATGTVDERALLASRRRSFAVNAQRQYRDEIVLAPGGTWVRRTTSIRWTLRLRRLR